MNNIIVPAIIVIVGLFASAMQLNAHGASNNRVASNAATAQAIAIEENEQGASQYPDFTAQLFEPTPVRSIMPIEDAFIEEACIFEVEAQIRPRILSDELGDYDINRATRLKRTCIVMSLCDTINGKPDYFAIVKATMGSPYHGFCSGVTDYGQSIIEAEPLIFDHALNARDMFREHYRTDGRKAAMEQAHLSVEKPEAVLKLGDKTSPFTIE